MKKTKPKNLKPIVVEDSWATELERVIKKFFATLIYDPLLETIKDVLQENSVDSPLVRAIKSGRLTYRDGVFTGKFTSELSKIIKDLGGRWDLTKRGYRIPREVLSASVLYEVDRYVATTRKLIDRVLGVIDTIPQNINRELRDARIRETADFSEQLMSKKMRETVTKSIGVVPTTTKKEQEQLKDQYTESIGLTIRDVSQEKTEDLRKLVEEFVSSGRPRDELVKRIRSHLRVSNERAKFIARQETNLYTSKLKQIQYQSVGIEKYIWRSTGGKSGDGRTRKAHKALHGRLCRWDDPPLKAKDASSGKDSHPQEDFNCRCTASPVVEF